jgi:hypothetical protein
MNHSVYAERLRQIADGGRFHKVSVAVAHELPAQFTVKAITGWRLVARPIDVTDRDDLSSINESARETMFVVHQPMSSAVS